LYASTAAAPSESNETVVVNHFYQFDGVVVALTDTPFLYEIMVRFNPRSESLGYSSDPTGF
jgi:hypothetical protein